MPAHTDVPTPSRQPHVVVVGGGFGGLSAARGLAGAPVRVTLVDRSNHHLFQPLLYQVATAALDSASVAMPLRRLFRRQRNATVLLAEVERIDPGLRRLHLEGGGSLDYDILVLASGATHAYFGNDHWAPWAPGLKTLDDALGIRRRVLMAFEAAEREPDPEKRRAWLNLAVIGAGPTGAELAGALAEIARHALRDEFRNIDPASARICLIEAGPRVLGTYSERLSASARRQLERLGVEVQTGCKVTGIDADGVHFEGRRSLAARTVLWGAGVAASPLGACLPAERDRAGRVRVRPDLTVPGHPELYVIGDLAALEQDGTPVPGIAPAAKQMGQYVARAVRARIDGRDPPPFRYRHYGSMATLGRRHAIAEFHGRELTGTLAWWTWLLAHIYFLIGFRNRLVVMLDWAWAYWSHRRNARIIFGEPPGVVPPDAPPGGEALPAVEDAQEVGAAPGKDDPAAA